MNPEPTTWFSRREVEQHFGCSYDKVRRADEEGRLPGRRNRGGDVSRTATVEYRWPSSSRPNWSTRSHVPS
jgi:hypothetical protein